MSSTQVRGHVGREPTTEKVICKNVFAFVSKENNMPIVNYDKRVLRLKAKVCFRSTTIILHKTVVKLPHADLVKLDAGPKIYI